MQGWNDQQQPHQHGKSDGGVVQVPWLPQGVEFLGLADTGTLSMWSGNNKKSHFSSRCTIQSNRDISVFSSSWLYFCISMKSKVGSCLWKVKTKSQRDLLSQTLHLPSEKTQSPVILQASSQAQILQENEAQHWEPLAFRGCQRHTQLLAALFNCCYAWPFQDPYSNRVRTSMSVNNALQQLGQIPVAPSVPGVWWLPLQPRRGHLLSHSTALTSGTHTRPRAAGKGWKSLFLLVSLCSSALLSFYFYLLSI